MLIIDAAMIKVEIATTIIGGKEIVAVDNTSMMIVDRRSTVTTRIADGDCERLAAINTIESAIGEEEMTARRAIEPTGDRTIGDAPDRIADLGEKLDEE